MNELKFLLAAALMVAASVAHAGHRRSVVQQDCCVPEPAVQVQSVPQTVQRTRMVPQVQTRQIEKRVPREVKEMVEIEKTIMVPKVVKEQVEQTRIEYDTVIEEVQETVCVPEVYTETVCVDCVPGPAARTQTTCSGANCWSHADLARYHGYEAVQEMGDHGLFHRLRARRAVKKLSKLREPDAVVAH